MSWSGRLPGKVLAATSVSSSSPVLPSRDQLGPRLFGGPALHQRLGLRQVVREQQRVVLAFERVVAQLPARKSQGISFVPWWINW
jgi:hypothetical protein